LYFRSDMCESTPYLEHDEGNEPHDHAERAGLSSQNPARLL
jgi:hypothetical protein